MIKVLLFAHLQEEVGENELLIEADGWMVKEVKEHIQQRFPTVSLGGVIVAINEEFSFDEDFIHEGDTIALLPPVSGG